MDAFAVSVVSGTAYDRLKVRHAFRIAFFFGAFQAFMPLIGSLASLTVKKYLAGYDHWFAFVILSAVGGRMVYGSFQIKKTGQVFDPSSFFVLLMLAIATSIDALAVGLTLSMIVSSIISAAVTIGLITFVLSYIGVFTGKKLGHFFENKIEAIGGLVLIALVLAGCTTSDSCEPICNNRVCGADGCGSTCGQC